MDNDSVENIYSDKYIKNLDWSTIYKPLTEEENKKLLEDMEYICSDEAIKNLDWSLLASCQNVLVDIKPAKRDTDDDKKSSDNK